MTSYTEACRHEGTGLTRRTFSNGVTHFVLQCTGCGSQVRNLSRRDPLVLDLLETDTEIPEFDDELKERYWQQRTGHWDQLRTDAEAARERERRERREAYESYLRSPEWRDRRHARLRLDRWKCQARMVGCTDEATEVHHTTYAHIFNEPLFDLVSVCRSCHLKITEMDRPQAIQSEVA